MSYQTISEQHVKNLLAHNLYEIFVDVKLHQVTKSAPKTNAF